MPKKFNDQEKDWLRQKLLEQGKQKFETLGLKKTSVEDLTSAVGIAQGSFYLFFGSKEELFYFILLDEEKRIRQYLLESFLTEEPVTKEKLKHFMKEAFRVLSESPLIKQIYLEGQLEQLIRKLPPELLEQNFVEDQDAFMPIIRNWQASGLLRDVQPELITSLFRSLVLLSLHKKEIGERHYADTIDLLIEMIAEGMFASHPNKEAN